MAFTKRTNWRMAVWVSLSAVDGWRTINRITHTSLNTPDSKVHGANMGPTWVLSTPDGPHVGPTNLTIRDNAGKYAYVGAFLRRAAHPKPPWLLQRPCCQINDSQSTLTMLNLVATVGYSNSLKQYYAYIPIIAITQTMSERGGEVGNPLVLLLVAGKVFTQKTPNESAKYCGFLEPCFIIIHIGKYLMILLNL